ncbi:MAG: hypothetical protein NC901_02880 [Candidatus Omnitrophica bacterium]|nr:hypothetical protein [Candidatus Omnitrophota bacterium]
MPAQVSIKELNGEAPGTPTTVTNIIHCTQDTYNPGNTYRIPIVPGEVRRGYWKTIYLNADTTPDTRIDNVKLYTPGSYPSSWQGITIKIGTTTTYVQATGTPYENGDLSEVATVDIITYTQSNPLSINGYIENPNTGRITDFIVLQAFVDGDEANITSDGLEITFQYDES